MSIFCYSYHKFTRGKDLSRYSATDLNCILGSEAVKKKRKDDEDEERDDKKSKTFSEPASPSRPDLRSVGYKPLLFKHY